MAGVIDHFYFWGVLVAGMAVWAFYGTPYYIRLCTAFGEAGRIRVYRDGIIQSLALFAMTVAVWAWSDRSPDALLHRMPMGGGIGALGTFGTGFLVLSQAWRLGSIALKPATLLSRDDWSAIADQLPRGPRAVWLYWINLLLTPFGLGFAYAGFACWYVGGLVPPSALLIAALATWMVGGIGGGAVLAYRWFVMGFVLTATYLATGNLWIAMAVLVVYDTLTHAGVWLAAWAGSKG